jgi:hypothetical protein
VIDEYWHDRARKVCSDAGILAKCGFAKDITDKTIKEQIINYSKACKDRLTELITIVMNEGIIQLGNMETLKVEEISVNQESDDYIWLERVQKVYAELKKRTWISVKEVRDPMYRKEILDWFKIARDGLIQTEDELMGAEER